MDKMLTVVELSEVFKISLSTAYQLVNSEGFPAIRVGKRRILIPASQLTEWAKKNMKN